MTKTFTRRGFVSMLASVPLVVVAAPKIFLPESARDRDLRLYYEYISLIQRDMELAIYAAIIRNGPIMYTPEGLSRVTEATKSVLGKYYSSQPQRYTLSIPELGIIEQPVVMI